MEPREVLTRYAESYRRERETIKAIEAKIEKREKQVERLKAKREKAWKSSPSWINETINPIAEAMLEHLPGRYYEILGPFGLGARVSIHFYKEGITEDTPWEERFTGDNCLSITFEPCDLTSGDIRLVDEKTDTGKFARNTLGEVNGFNHPRMPMPRSTQGLISFLMKQNKPEEEVTL